MIPVILSFEDCEECTQTDSFNDKETQTNLAESSSSTSRKQRNGRNHMKRCETESQNKDTPETTSSTQAIKNTISKNYSYCKEFLCKGINSLSSYTSELGSKVKDYKKDDSVRVQSCVIICAEDNMKSNDCQHCSRSSETVCGTSNSKDRTKCPDPPSDRGSSCCCCNTDPQPKERPKCPPPLTECERKPNICDKTLKEANECKLKGCVTKCVKENVKKIKRDQSHCETVIGYIPSKNPNDKTIFYPFNRLRERGSIVCEQKKSGVQEFIERQSTSVMNMSSAVGNLLCRMYNRTKEAIGMSPTTDCGPEIESVPSCPSKKPCQRKCPVKCDYESESETEIAQNVRNLSSDSEADVVKAENAEGLNVVIGPIAEIYNSLCNSVKASVSSFGEKSYISSLADIITLPKPDKSSPYDVPTPCPEQCSSKPCEPEPEPPTPNEQSLHKEVSPVQSGMMTSVKNKIYSIFCRNKSATSIPPID